MEWVETTGRTIAEAKREALDSLGVAEEDAEFDVLAEAKAGLFGRVRTEARVRARVRPTTPRAKDDRRDRRRRSGRNGDDAQSGPAVDGPPGIAAPATAAGAGDGPDGTGSRAGAGSSEGAPRPSRPAAPQPAAPEPAAPVDQPDLAPVERSDVALAVQAEVAKSFLDGVLACFQTPGHVEVNEIDENTVELSVIGDDLALLIGPKGATVSALQDLARTVVQRRTGAHQGRLLVDVGGYRHKRKVALERFTKQVADTVLASGQDQALEPMAAADRKVVHDTINGIEGVMTRSEGEEPRRRVVILPRP